MHDACTNGTRLAGATASSRFAGDRCFIRSPALYVSLKNSHRWAEIICTHDTPHSSAIWRGDHMCGAGRAPFFRFVVSADFEGIQGTRATITDASVLRSCPHTIPTSSQYKPYRQRTQEPSVNLQNRGFRGDMSVTNSSGGTIFGAILW